MSNQIALWFKALRAPFFQAVIVPTILGTAIAWQETGHFHWGYFILTLVGIIFINAGTNLSNDYFDHRLKADEVNTVYTPFSGGSRVIQDQQIKARTIHRVAILCFCAAAVIGLFLTYARGWPILAIGLVGVLSGYFYTATPTRLVYRGWGELFAGLNCGPLAVLGAYYVQARQFTPGVVVASLPIGFLAAGILYINQFTDYEPDQAAGKETLIVKLGPQRAVKGYFFLLLGVYGVIVIGSALRVLPWLSLIALASLPLALKAAFTLKKEFNNREKMIPVMASNIMTHLGVGLLLSTGYVLAGIFY
jgi:1,4-dihydroxy-2-naphthoate octaprenyltransferase